MTTTPTDKQAKISERIALLLAKAESTTPEEAEALTEAAAKLMVKYSIDQAVIDAKRAKSGQASEKIIETKMEFTGAYRGELLDLAFRVCSSLGQLRNMQYTGSNGGKTFQLWIIGFESDVAQAKLLIESLEIQAAVAVREWWKANKDLYSIVSSYEQEKHRRSFVKGFGAGAGKRIRENRNQVVEEMKISKGTELVLVSRKDQVDAFMDAKNLRNGRSRNATGGGMAGAAGVAAGLKANTGEKSVGNRKAVGA